MVDHNTENISERKQVLIIKLEWEKGKENPKKPTKKPKTRTLRKLNYICLHTQLCNCGWGSGLTGFKIQQNLILLL